jgi:hypothetical protein
MRRRWRVTIVLLLALGTLGVAGGVANAEPADCDAWGDHQVWLAYNSAYYGGAWNAVYETWDQVGRDAGCW